MENEINENTQIDNKILDTVLQNNNNEIKTQIDDIAQNKNNSLKNIFLEKVKNLQILIKRESSNKKICKYIL